MSEVDRIYKQWDCTKDEDGWIVASSPTLDRDKDRIPPTSIETGRFLKNPVLMWGHNYFDPWATIGRAKEVKINGDLRLLPEFRTPANDGDPMNIIQHLWDGGFVRAASIGFIPHEWEENAEGGRDYTRLELLEVSLVPIGANQDALRLAVKALGEPARADGYAPGWDALQTQTMNSVTLAGELASVLVPSIVLVPDTKTVIPHKRHPLAPEDHAWDAGGARSRLREWAGGEEWSPAKYRQGFVFIAGDPENITSYKGPHHDIIGGGLKTVWHGVHAAMGSIVFGARGGRIADESDRRGVYGHLSKHYKEFDKEVPEFRDMTAEEVTALFGDGQPGASDADNDQLRARLDALEEALSELKKELNVTE